MHAPLCESTTLFSIAEKIYSVLSYYNGRSLNHKQCRKQQQYVSFQLCSLPTQMRITASYLISMLREIRQSSICV